MPIREDSLQSFYDDWSIFYDNTIPDNEKNARGNRVLKLQDLFEDRFSGDVGRINVLDLGCGTGAYALDFARAGYSVTGIDISQKMLDICEKRNQELPAIFKCADWNSELLNHNERFHIIICAGNSLHHNPKSYLRELFPLCYRALKSDGVIILNSRDYKRELGLALEEQKRNDLQEIFQAIEVPGFGERNVLTYMHRNNYIKDDKVFVAFYTYSNYRADRRTFNCHFLEHDLDMQGSGKMQVVSTDVYYLFKDEVKQMLKAAGFMCINGKTGLDSSKSWYLSAIKP